MSAQNAVDMKKKVAATRKAFKLLRRHLDDYQKMELKKFGHFHVRSSDGFLYRIEKASCWNVFRIEDGEVTANFCVIFENHLIPIPDQMLIQKFMLQSDPESFFRIANKNYDPQPRSRPRIIRTESGFANLAGVQRINVLENDVVRAA